jgi:DNA-binding transcriptional LysR family regulator
LYPGVQISIYRNFSYKIVEKLENGSIDVGIVTLPVKSASLKTHSIFRDQLMLMVSPQNALAKLDVVPVSEVAKQPLLLPKTGYSRRVMDKLFRPYASHLQIRMELPSVGMIKSFVAAGLGVSLISSSFAKDQVLAGRVKLIPIRDQELWRELGIAYRRDRTHTRATTTFISTVRQLATASKRVNVGASVPLVQRQTSQKNAGRASFPLKARTLIEFVDAANHNFQFLFTSRNC